MTTKEWEKEHDYKKNEKGCCTCTYSYLKGKANLKMLNILYLCCRKREFLKVSDEVRKSYYCKLYEADPFSPEIIGY